jgi:DNA (cytosine-5)-methyltransferase 1
MNHIGLFEGIGGFSLAARWMGWETIAWCEWNEFGQKVLKHHFPKAQPHGNITQTDFTIYRGQCDIVTGGFPCQPYSLAGKRKGKADDRHLWPEMLRAIREIQPTWVVGENVFGLVNWDGGLVFNEVQADLEAEGYEVFPYVLPAVSVNAPHRRDRIWFVAYSNVRGGCREKGIGQHDLCGSERKEQDNNIIKTNKGLVKRKSTEFTTHPHSTPTEHTVSTRGNLPTGALQQDAANPNSNGQHGSNSEHEINTSEGGEYAQCNIEQMGSNDVTDTDSERQQECNNAGQSSKPSRQPYKAFSSPQNWNNFPTQSPIRSGDDGLSTRLDSITFPKWRNESIKAAGNAIVPQVAFQIFKTIKLYNEKL